MPAVRGPNGKFLSKAELAELEKVQSQTQETNTNVKERKMSNEIDTPQFVDDFPPVKRGSRSSGVWKERLAPLHDNPGQVAAVYGPTPNPHAVINNIKQGNAAGIDHEDYTFRGIMDPELTELVYDKETGEPVIDEDTGEQKERTLGFVYARFDTPEQKEERLAKLAEKRAARAEREEDAA